MSTHRAIATTAPNASQIETFWVLMNGAVALAVAMKAHGNVSASIKDLQSELGRAIKGEPVQESTARVVAAAFETVGCGAMVVRA